MKLFKKALIVISVLILLLFALNFGVRYWIHKKLPDLINPKDSPYTITYEELKINILSGSASLKNTSIIPVDSLKHTQKQNISANIKNVDIKNIGVWNLITSGPIEVNKVIISQPEITFNESVDYKEIEKEIKEPFSHIINTKSLEVENGTLKMVNKKNEIILNTKNISVTVRDIEIDSTTLNKNIPAKYSSYTFSCDSLFYKPDAFYHLTADKIKNSEKDLIIENFKMIPLYSKESFTKALSKERDLFAIVAEKITVPELDWSFTDDAVFYAHTKQAVFEKINATIYRNKIPEDDLSIKPLYSELLRSIKFDLKIDELLIKNSIIKYEEQIDFSRPAAEVSFSKFYATIRNVNSPVNKKKLPPVSIDVKCIFMKSSQLTVNWTFDILDKSDAFNIRGHLKHIKAELLDPITKPLMNATTTGEIKDVKFNFNGNRNTATGTFSIDYSNLKVSLYKKDGKDKNKLMSALGNILVKNSTRDRQIQTDVAVERNKTKSFYNFLWISVQDGLKKTVLPI